MRSFSGTEISDSSPFLPPRSHLKSFSSRSSISDQSEVGFAVRVRAMVTKEKKNTTMIITAIAVSR